MERKTYPLTIKIEVEFDDGKMLAQKSPVLFHIVPTASAVSGPLGMTDQLVFKINKEAIGDIRSKLAETLGLLKELEDADGKDTGIRIDRIPIPMPKSPIGGKA